ncbi:hypothetical protein [Sodalis sp. dw_96]|uniref:hypothetical protein n=1 Tax=Sodalis sp. dw_96 TaxID=2719794 RepID=UPI001BD55CF0|nr:hypothetical protein [Sodalis sp. dw_96]
MAHNLLRYFYASQAILPPRAGISGNAGTRLAEFRSFLGQPDITLPRTGRLQPYAYHLSEPSVVSSVTRSERRAAEDIPPFPSRGKRQLADEDSAGLLPFAIQNEHVAFYLQKEGLLSVESGSDGPLLINRVIDFLTCPSPHLSEITRALLAESGLFGAQKNEALGIDYQRRQVNAWIAANTFDDSPEGFFMTVIINKRMGRNGRKPRRHINNGELRAAFNRHLAGLTSLNATAVRHIYNEIVVPTMPTLGIRKDKKFREGNRVGSMEWVYLHAAAHFAHEMQLGYEKLSKRTLLSLGIALEAMLLTDTVSAGIIRFFIRPACIYFLVNKVINGKLITNARVFTDPDIRQEAVKTFFADSQLRNEKNNPFGQYSRAIEGYRTRTQMAEDILRERCDVNAKGRYSVDAESYKNGYDGYACQMANGGQEPTIELLPNVSNEFLKQNQHIAEQYRAVDLLLLAESFDTLSSEDRLFLEEQEIKLVTAHYSAFDQVRGALGGHTVPRSRLTVELSPEVTLFSTTGAEKIYALHRRGTGYILQRVDRDPSRYYPLLNDLAPQKDRDYVLKIFAGGSQATVLKRAGESLDSLIINLSGLAQRNLLILLNNQGYDVTTRENVAKRLLSLVPLHDCISGIIHGDRQAVVPCLFDIFSLLPLLGMAGSLVSRVAVHGGIGTVAAIRISLGSYVAKQSLSKALSAGASQFAKYAMAPAARELNRQALITVAVELARFSDPAMVEVLFRSGMALSKKFAAAAQVVARHLPEIAPVLPRMDKLSQSYAVVKENVSSTTARLADTHRYLRVTELAGDKYLGQAIYVRIEPHLGGVLGKKYTLSHNNQLIPVPTSAAVRLKNILREGLGGKGGNRAARVWNTQQSFNDLVPVNLPQYPNPQYIQIESYGSRAAESVLFPELGIPLQQTPLDLEAYAYALEALPVFQKKAIKAWTMIERGGNSGFDGLPISAHRMMEKSIHTEINQHLFQKDPIELWEPKERLVLSGLLAAFNSPLPRQTGSFLRVAEYKHNQIIPWADTIGPGDVVTNYPGLMSVFAEDVYSRLGVQSAKEYLQDESKALIYYKIHGGAHCLPLPYYLNSNGRIGFDYLYQPNSFFRVVSISNAALVGGEMYPATRIGVVLEEINEPIDSAKNLFTGELFQFK